MHTCHIHSENYLQNKLSSIGFAKTIMNILLLFKFINIALILLILKVKKDGFMLYIVLGNTEDLKVFSLCVKFYVGLELSVK